MCLGRSLRVCCFFCQSQKFFVALCYRMYHSTYDLNTFSTTVRISPCTLQIDVIAHYDGAGQETLCSSKPLIHKILLFGHTVTAVQSPKYCGFAERSSMENGAYTFKIFDAFRKTYTTTAHPGINQVLVIWTVCDRGASVSLSPTAQEDTLVEFQ